MSKKREPSKSGVVVDFRIYYRNYIAKPNPEILKYFWEEFCGNSKFSPRFCSYQCRTPASSQRKHSILLWFGMTEMCYDFAFYKSPRRKIYTGKKCLPSHRNNDGRGVGDEDVGPRKAAKCLFLRCF